MSDALNNMGVIYQQQGRADLAIRYYEQSMELEKELGNGSGVAEGLSNMGEASAILQEMDEAVSYFNRAATEYEALGDLVGEASVLINLARLYRRDGQLDRAFEIGSRAMALNADISDRSLKLRIFAELAEIHAVRNVIGNLGSKQQLFVLKESGRDVPFYGCDSIHNCVVSVSEEFRFTQPKLYIVTADVTHMNQVKCLYRIV